MIIGSDATNANEGVQSLCAKKRPGDVHDSIGYSAESISEAHHRLEGLAADATTLTWMKTWMNVMRDKQADESRGLAVFRNCFSYLQGTCASAC